MKKLLNNQSILKLLKPFLFIVVCAAIFLIIPNKSVTNKYMMKIINEGGIYFIAVLGLSVMLGMGGQVTFSTAGIMGIGAYVCAILTVRHSWSAVPALIVSLIIGTIFSLIVGLALFRLKGSYFSFASIGLTSLIVTILQNWIPVTGGPDGINKIPALNLYIFKCSNYYDYFKVYFVIAIICGLIVYRMRKTYFGRALASVRDNSIAAECMGINAYRTKVISFVIAGVFASLAGAMFAFHSGYISPDSFSYDKSAIYLVMVMLGGVDSTLGAFIGSMFLTILPEKLRFLSGYLKLVYGAGVIVLMIVMPMGITGFIDIIRHKLRNVWKKRKEGEVEVTAEEVKQNA